MFLFGLWGLDLLYMDVDTWGILLVFLIGIGIFIYKVLYSFYCIWNPSYLLFYGDNISLLWLKEEPFLDFLIWNFYFVWFFEDLDVLSSKDLNKGFTWKFSYYLYSKSIFTILAWFNLAFNCKLLFYARVFLINYLNFCSALTRKSS